MRSTFRFQDFIQHETDDHVVINKPPYIATLPDAYEPSYNILTMARKYCATLRVCHRLDKGTSGLLVFAKHAGAYRNLALQFEEQSVQKTYHAVLEGIHTFHDHLVDGPIYVRSGNCAVIDHKRGKLAATRFDTLEYFWQHTLVACKPLTGRTHQIRVHVRSQGAPMVGDVAYGGSLLYLSRLKKGYKQCEEQVERPLMGRVALHAWGITFLDTQKRCITLTASYPKDFRALVYQLAKQRLAT